MMAVLEDALDHGNRIQREKADAQMDLFADTEGGEALPVSLPSMPDIPELDDNDLLAMEKETLGFYITGHPLDRYEEMIKKFANVNSETLGETPEGQSVRMGGALRPLKILKTKKGDMMAFAALEDKKGSVEVVIFPELYQEVHYLLNADAPVILQAEVQKRENNVKLLAEQIVPIDKAEAEWTASIVITMAAKGADTSVLERLKGLLHRFAGTCSVFLEITVEDGSSVVIQLSQDELVSPDPLLFQEVEALLGQNAIETRCAPVKQRERKKRWQNNKQSASA
jgi:DNA polymerase-3 subunit alpha